MPGGIEGNEHRPLYLGRVDFATARDAVARWHYTGRISTCMAAYGVWEFGTFRGVVVFSQGAAPNVAKAFGLNNGEVRELVRVALNEPTNPTSKIVAVALMLFRREFPSVKAVVSYADTAQNHNGTIYQAGNWIYLGSKCHSAFVIDGVMTHPKTLYGRYGKGGQAIPWLRANVDPAAQRVKTPAKHKYVYCFDDDVRNEWRAKAKPYPSASKV